MGLNVDLNPELFNQFVVPSMYLFINFFPPFFSFIFQQIYLEELKQAPVHEGVPNQDVSNNLQPEHILATLLIWCQVNYVRGKVATVKMSGKNVRG